MLHIRGGEGSSGAGGFRCEHGLCWVCCCIPLEGQRRRSMAKLECAARSIHCVQGALPACPCNNDQRHRSAAAAPAQSEQRRPHPPKYEPAAGWHAAGARQRVGQGQVSAQGIAPGASGRPQPSSCRAAALPAPPAPRRLPTASPCRQHGALGFSGIPRTEAEELANQVAALQAKVRRRQGLLLAVRSSELAALQSGSHCFSGLSC